MKKLLTMLIALTVAFAAQATLLVYEGFDYTSGASVTNVGTGGTGFGNDWYNTADGNPTVGSSSLTYGSLQTSGRSVSFSDSGRQRIYRDTVDLDSYYDAGETVYVSFLTSNSGNYEYKTFFGDLAGSDGVGWSHNGDSWGADSGAGLGVTVGDATNTVNLMVMGVDIVSDDGGEARTVNLSYWINPTSLAGSAPTATFTTNNVSVNLDPTEIYISEDPGASLDEIRIGTTYADVTPVPEPATVVMLGLGTLLTLLFRRLRK